jgi:hypothetical protein
MIDPELSLAWQTEDLPTSTKNKFSMAFLELYPIVVAAVL